MIRVFTGAKKVGVITFTLGCSCLQNITKLFQFSAIHHII